MNMLTRPDLVQSIEIMDGTHFVESSLAQFCFRILSSPDSSGHSLSLDGEVFKDAIWVNGSDEVQRIDEFDSAYDTDVTARRIVAATLFGYEGPSKTGGDQPVLFGPTEKDVVRSNEPYRKLAV